MPSVRKTTPIREEVDALVVIANALLVAVTALRSEMGGGQNVLLGRDQLTATVADLAELKAKYDALVVSYNATLAKLDADAGVTDVNYAATNPGVASAAMTTSATVTITSGTTAGKAKTRADVEYEIGGTLYRKAKTDDLWDLSAETDPTGAQFRAYRLMLDSAGTATIIAGSNAASEALALAAIGAEASTKATIAVYVAGLSTDFNGAAGLAAQGTFYEGGTALESNPAALTAVAITQIDA